VIDCAAWAGMIHDAREVEYFSLRALAPASKRRLRWRKAGKYRTAFSHARPAIYCNHLPNIPDRRARRGTRAAQSARDELFSTHDFSVVLE
jgi:hypothetical protein